MTTTVMEPQTDEDFHIDTEPETEEDMDPQTPAMDPRAQSVANRPKNRHIQRWTDPQIIRVFAGFRKNLSEEGIEWKPALEAAIKKYVSIGCTVDALVQQLVKRATKFDKEKAAAIASGSADSKSGSNKKQTPVKLQPLKAADSKASNGKAKAVATKVTKVTLATPAPTPKKTTARNKMANSKRVKAEKRSISPVTPPQIDDESDSEYTESANKSRNKRVRGANTKTAQKATSKKIKQQLSDSESEFEDEMIDTPSKKSAKKANEPTSVKKGSSTTAAIQPGPARKVLSAIVATAGSVEVFEELEKRKDEYEKSGVVEGPHSPPYGLGSPLHADAPYEVSSGHELVEESLPWVPVYTDEPLNNSVSPDLVSYGQVVHNHEAFGGYLYGDHLPASGQSHFDTPISGMPSNRSNRAISSSVGHSHMGQYAGFQSMPHKPSLVSYVPAVSDSHRMHMPGDFIHGIDNYNPALFHQTRHTSFSTNASEEAPSFADFLSGRDQSIFFDESSGNIGDHNHYGLFDNGHSFGGS